MQLRVRLTPRAGRNEIRSYDGEVVSVRVTSPPVEGAANKALILLLAEALAVPKSAISIKSGAASREKLIVIDAPVAQITCKLDAYLRGTSENL